MRTQFRHTLIAAFAATTLSSTAYAADIIEPVVDSTVGTELYLAGFAGISFAKDIDTTLRAPGGAAGQTYDVDFDSDIYFGGALGVKLNDFGTGSVTPRLELEVSHSSDDVDSIFFSGNGPGAELNVAGDVSTTLVMINALADFDTGTAFTPFVGGGLGIGFVDYSFSYQTGPLIQVNQSDQGFAAQIIAGVSYELTENLDFTFDGRYSRVFDVESTRIANGAVNTATVREDFDRFAITAGLRYTF